MQHWCGVVMELPQKTCKILYLVGYWDQTDVQTSHDVVSE